MRNVEAVADHASALAGFTGPDLVEWVRASDRHAAFLVAALEAAWEAAWEALDTQKLRTLGSVLADGMRDEARLDIDQLESVQYAS